MYLARRPLLPDDEVAVTAGAGGSGWRRLIVAPNVVLLGMTSLVTDVSSEMVASILPLYLTARLGFTALQFGLTDGLMQVAVAVTALVGALLTDRWRRYREVAGIGYGLSAASRLGLVGVTGWLPTLGWLGADRVGKGIRTAPRDALISLSAPPGRLGEAFGLHRALDTGGALIGPLGAVLLLSLAPGSYQTVFLASFFIALIGLALLWLFVQNRGSRRQAQRLPVLGPMAALWSNRRFRRVLVATALLNIAAVSDSFLFLTLRRSVGLDQRWFPILFVVESVLYLCLAVPCGRLADRVGPGRVLLVGQVALAASYALLIAMPSRAILLAGVPACLGVFFAATDGVLSALASHAVAESTRTTGLAVVGLVVAGGRAVAAAGFGAIWLRSGPHQAVIDALIILGVGAVLATLVLRPMLDPTANADRRPRHARRPPPPPSEPVASAPVPPTSDADDEVASLEVGINARRRVGMFVVIAALCAGGIVWTTTQNAARIRAASAASSAHLATLNARQPPTVAPAAAAVSALDQALGRTHVLLLDTAEGATFERLEVEDRDDATGARTPTPLVCERVDQQGGRGLCLTNDRVNDVHGISVFSDDFKILVTLPLSGLPSRTQVAPNGHVGAATSFVQGDAYNVDNFSTRTVLIDLVGGRIIGDLESFTLTKDRRPLHPIDENFWGVTFAADSDTFYATLRTGRHYYLIRGHVGSHQAEVLRDVVECPSISPDGRELVYKSRIDHGLKPATWRLHVLDLATLADHPLAETRSVDDQAAWLDNTHVVYGIAEAGTGSGLVDSWSVPADGSGKPTLVFPAAESLVVHPSP